MMALGRARKALLPEALDPNWRSTRAIVRDYKGTAPCPNEAALPVRPLMLNPCNAGTDGTITVCPEAPNVDLSLLGGDPDAGGLWTAPNGTSCDGDFDPGPTQRAPTPIRSMASRHVRTSAPLLQAPS